MTKASPERLEGEALETPATMTADEAMSRYAQGEASAFEIVYDAVAPRLQGYLRRHLREASRVDDIVQQTFLQMHCARGTFICGAEVLPWAFAIARRLMIDTVRKTSREECRDLSNDEERHAAVMASVVATGEEVVAAREAGKRISDAYEQMSEAQRAAFELVKADGLSHAQAASILGTTVTGVKLRAHRAYLALRAALTDSPGSKHKRKERR